MDRMISKAIEEICSHGKDGITISLLWRRLHSPLSSSGLGLGPKVKLALLTGLSDVPGIRFKDTKGVEFGRVEESRDVPEEGIKVFGNERIRLEFLGLYDIKSCDISDTQMQVLERLGVARESGVTQMQLWKEMKNNNKKMKANNFFFVLKKLECWGLIVRHSTIVRPKEASNDTEPKNCQPVHTNLIYLHRYAPSLSSLQRLEINKESNKLDENYEDNVPGLDDDGVVVKDFLASLKAVCDKLEHADGKVLVVSDIKKELEYCSPRGHKAWRKVCDRLKQAGLIEEFKANVSSQVEIPANSTKSKAKGPKKPVNSLKLLKKFSAKLFQNGSTDCDYDSVASDEDIVSGKQVQNTEHVVELSLEQQIIHMIDAAGPKGVLGVEVRKRLGINNRLFDTLSRTLVSPFGLQKVSENCEKGSAYRFWTRKNFYPTEDPPQGENSGRTTTTAEYLNFERWLTDENTEKGISDEELKHGSQQDRGIKKTVHDVKTTVPHTVNKAQSNSPVDTPFGPVPKLFNLQQGRIYPSLTSVTREQHIIDLLKTEKIIIKHELHRRLESFEENKTTIDRKTIWRCLTKLQHEGHCRIMKFNIPEVSNCGRHREIYVILHPSLKGSSSELSEQVLDKLRIFDCRTVSRPEKGSPVPILHGIQRIQMDSTSDVRSINLQAMRANGFVLSKVVRSKLLHRFLWVHANDLAKSIDVSTSTEHVNGPSNTHTSCLLFSLDTAIKAMPLELFLQVVGSALKWKDNVEKCKNGVLLFDFTDDEYKSLLNAQATSRLSRLIDILCQLKLIKLVADENNPRDAIKKSQATLVYALNLEPYIEEPPSVSPMPGCTGSIDLQSNFRHDFVLSNTEAVEKYWQTLECCYATAHPNAAAHAFPGSVAYKVLRAYYYNRRQRLSRDLDVQVMGSNTSNHRPQSQRKRKSLSDGSFVKHVFVDSPIDSIEIEEDEQVQLESSTEKFSMPMFKQALQSKFSWTEEADRQLIILYSRQKAIQGARYGTDWASISDLPAAPTTCRRRLAYLNANIKFRKSLMGLCNMLTQRYVQYLDRETNLLLEGNSEELNSRGIGWDDFEASKIKAALHKVLTIKKMMKQNPNKKTKCAFQGPYKPDATIPSGLEDVSINGRVHKSLAVSSAVELIKLCFLTNPKSSDMPDLLADTFRQYSQHDLSSAYDYLRQKGIMIGSDTSISLSQSFLRDLSLSQFPINTGKRAAALVSWIHENEKTLMEGSLNLSSDIQCGDIYQLMALVSSGELSISPLLPHEGVGEAEDSRNPKRKYTDHEYDNFGVNMKRRCQSLQESDFFPRRDKGFPGLTVSLCRTSILRSNVVDFFKDANQNLLSSENDHFYATLGQKNNCVKSPKHHVKEAPDFDSIAPSTVISGDSIWEIMANYSSQNLLIHLGREKSLIDHELIKSTYINIQKAGDQGLSMSKVSACIGLQGTMLSEHVINVLQLFSFVIKVDGYNDVHVVDSLYRAKYLLTSTTSRDPQTTPSANPQRVNEVTNMVEEVTNNEHEANCLNANDVHKVTFLNLPEESQQLPNSVQVHDTNFEGCNKTITTSKGGTKNNHNLDVITAYYPISPWINRDGTINAIVYRGLTRFILGIVTQKPGILEDGILREMNVLNPQCCRNLLELMVLDKHLFRRNMSQRISPTTTFSLLDGLIGKHFSKPRYVSREHYFANPKSAALL